MRASHHVEVRKSWDKIVESQKCVEVVKNKTLIVHTVNITPIPGVSNRDMVEKKFKFT